MKSNVKTRPVWVNPQFEGATFPGGVVLTAEAALQAPRLPYHHTHTPASPRFSFSSSFWRDVGKCPRRAAFRRIDEIRPRSEARALIVGRAYHDAVSAAWVARHNGDSPTAAADVVIDEWAASQYERLSAMTDEQLGLTPFNANRIEEESKLIQAVVRSWLALPTDLELVAVGVPFRVPIPRANGRDSGVDLVGEFDALVTDGRALIPWELKGTSGSVTEYQHAIDSDAQANGYALAGHRLFSQSPGVVWDVARKHRPSIPGFLVCQTKACKARRAEAEAAEAAWNELRLDPLAASDAVDAAEARCIRPRRHSLASVGLAGVWAVEEADLGAVPWHGDAACTGCGGSGVVGLSKSATATTPEILAARLAILAAVSPRGRDAVEAGEYGDLAATVDAEVRKHAARFVRNPAIEQILALPEEILGVVKSWRFWTRSGHFPHMRGNCRGIAQQDCPFLPICPALSAGPNPAFESTKDAPPVPETPVTEF